MNSIVHTDGSCNNVIVNRSLQSFKIIRKVDKQTALLDADDPVSQLHKVCCVCHGSCMK